MSLGIGTGAKLIHVDEYEGYSQLILISFLKCLPLLLLYVLLVAYTLLFLFRINLSLHVACNGLEPLEVLTLLSGVRTQRTKTGCMRLLKNKACCMLVCDH